MAINPPGFTDLRRNRAQIEEGLRAQQQASQRQSAETIAMLQTVTHATGYKVWKEALLQSADGEHQQALTAKDAHSMAIHLGAESAYRAAAHAAEDLIAMHTQAMKPR